MAEEIFVQAVLEVKNALFKSPRQGTQVEKFDQTVVGGGVPGQHTATTAGSNVDLSKLTAAGWCRMVNLDPNNFVEWGSGSMDLVGKMKPGEPTLFRIRPGSDLHLKADTADCEVQVTIFED